MQSREFARLIQTESMTGNICNRSAAMEALENVLLCSLRNWSPSVTDSQHHFGGISPGRDWDADSRAIVLARVALQRGVGGSSGRSLQFLAGAGESSFGTFSLHVIFLIMQRQLLYRNREAGGDQMADDKTAE